MPLLATKPQKTINGLSPEPVKPDPTATVAALKLLEYCRENAWAGYDPYDALNSRWLRLLPFLNFRLARLVLIQGLKRSPVNLRPMLLVPKTRNPKALALFLSGCLRLSEAGVLPDENIPDELVQAIAALRSPCTTDWCWGYSFPWQTRTVLVGRSEPNLVCTIFVADALLDYHERTGDRRSLEMALGAARYIARDLFWEADGVASFAYPLPGSRSRVHNANLLAAALLLRAGTHSHDKELRAPALKAARYSAGKQNADGSWFYGELPTQRWIDNFHTGFNLCALDVIGRCGQTDEFKGQVARGFAFYCEHFFLPDGAPKYFHDRAHPFDVHSAAQSLITLLRFQHLGTATTRAGTVLKWTMDRLQDKRGYFYYQQTRWGRVKIPYMRWSQAWMLRGLAEVVRDSAGVPACHP